MTHDTGGCPHFSRTFDKYNLSEVADDQTRLDNVPAALAPDLGLNGDEGIKEALNRSLHLGGQL